MLSSRSNRSLTSWLAPALCLLSSLATNGSICWAGQEPLHAPVVIQREENWKDQKPWAPILPNQELQPMSPEVQEAFEGIKSGRPERFEKAIRLAYHLLQAYGRSEGHDISIQVSDFKTFDVPEAWDLKVSDLFSFGQPEHIEVMDIHHEEIFTDANNKSRKTASLGYGMKWAPALPDPDLKLSSLLAAAEWASPAYELVRRVIQKVEGERGWGEACVEEEGNLDTGVLFCYSI